MTKHILALFIITSAISSYTAEQVILKNELMKEYQDIALQDGEQPRNNQTKKVTLKRAFDSHWLLQPDQEGNTVIKDIFHQELEFYGINAVADFGRFSTSDEAYVAAEFLAKEAVAAPYSPGVCSGNSNEMLGFQSWCVESMNEVGLIIVKGTLCLRLTTFNCGTVSIEEKRNVLIELAESVLLKREKSKK